MSESPAAWRRVRVTHTSSHVFDQAVIDDAWTRMRHLVPDYLLRGDEDENPESRAMTVYEAFSESLVELFQPQQDDDTGYEVEEYDPYA